MSSRANDSLTVTVQRRRKLAWMSSLESARTVELLETVSGERGDSRASLSRLVRLRSRRWAHGGLRADDDGPALRDMDGTQM